MEFELFSKIHVGIWIPSLREHRKRVAFPNQTHAEPQDAETIFESLSGTNGPDKARHDQTPKTSVYMGQGSKSGDMVRRTLKGPQRRDGVQSR